MVEIYGDEGGAAMLPVVSKALITTAVGLIIAIPSLGVYHGLKYRLNYMGDILEEELEALLNAWLLTEKNLLQRLNQRFHNHYATSKQSSWRMILQKWLCRH